MDNNTRKRMNEVMTEIANFIKNKEIKLNNENNNDGRIQSATSEKVILMLVKKFCENNKYVTYIESDIRDWRDFELKIDNCIQLPVNIKITSVNEKGFSVYDNVSSKEGLIWTFTNIEPSNNRSWLDLKYVLQKPIIDTNRDYYFLIVNKNIPKDIWFTSFKQMKCVRKNPNNLPFQARWTDNRELQTWSDFDAFKMLFNEFQKGLEGLQERINCLEGAMTAIREYDLDRKKLI